jgi:hypothetical protein
MFGEKSELTGKQLMKIQSLTGAWQVARDLIYCAGTELGEMENPVIRSLNLEILPA